MQRTGWKKVRGIVPAVIAGMLLLAVTGGVCRADRLYLRDGRVVEGLVEKRDKVFVVHFDKGAQTSIKAGEVVRHEKSLTKKQMYDNLKAVYAEDDFDAQMSLGKWCRMNALPDEAKAHFSRAIELNPNDPKARKAAGYLFFQGKWLTRPEYMHAKGKDLYKGKWIDAQQAKAFKERDKRIRQRREGFSAGWALLRAAAHDPKADNPETQRKLRDMGNYALDALIKGASDPNANTRRMTLNVLDSGTDLETLELLVSRLRFEKKKDLVTLAAKQLAARVDREQALKLVLELCVNSEFSKTRKRSWMALQYMADKRAIERLIPIAGYNPVPESESRMKEELKKTSGTVTIENYRRARSAYYPAAEALEYLTGQRFAQLREPWERWWEKNHETFTFKPLP